MKSNMAIGTKENALKKTAVTGKVFLILTILIMNLTACGSSNAEDMPDTATGEITVSIPETYEEYIILATDSYRQQDWENALVFYENAKKLDAGREEVYRGMSDVYLQMDEVIQALAVLDEGMEKCGDNHSIDSLSQRKEYVLAGVVAVKTKRTLNQYDDEGNIFSSRVSERDKNGNEIKSVYYGREGKIGRVTERQYDEDGNETEYKSISYDDDGSIYQFFHETWAYDADGNVIEYVSYDDKGNVKERKENEYDTNGNQIKHIEYDEKGKIVTQTETAYDAYGKEIDIVKRNKYYLESEIKIAYDENGNEKRYEVYVYDEKGRYTKKIIKDYDERGNQIQDIEYDAAGYTTEKWEKEYDENNNLIKYVHYNDAVTVDYWYEKEYDERGREIKYVSYGSLDGISLTWEKEYDEDGNKVKEIYADYDMETGKKSYQSTKEYAYGENGNMTSYAYTIDREAGECEYLRWEREYDENDRESAFYFYDNEKIASYQSKPEYDENGLVIKYTGYDKNGNMLAMTETVYDESGKVIRENHYDADSNLTQYYENEYDDFGSVTRQSMYEGDILKYEYQISYAYRYIGNIDAEAADYIDNDITPEEYNLKQREIFTRFLDGQEKVRYHSYTSYTDDTGSIVDGKIVEETITDFIDFEYCRQHKWTPEYTFLDMTGDGIEELVINCYGSKMYVIQCDRGILKVIHDDVGGNLGSYLVKYNESMGICHNFGGHVGGNEQYYYFFDEKGKRRIVPSDYQDFLEDGTESRSYAMSDNDSFVSRDISKGEYYDIVGMMITDIDIDWYELEEPD